MQQQHMAALLLVSPYRQSLLACATHTAALQRLPFSAVPHPYSHCEHSCATEGFQGEGLAVAAPTCNLQQVQQPATSSSLPVIVAVLMKHAWLVRHSDAVGHDVMCGVADLVALQQHSHHCLDLVDTCDGGNMRLCAQHIPAHTAQHGMAWQATLLGASMHAC
jgi:hypothetical protein